eukprot:TRINITY_DN11875_c0_g1_i1.p1 TRINITY_DN11875_c0_g1~~TRINITY_DN11875_c0_g1_i1.p1  ORF type:complete len:136 (+),score=24.11 TRINITY_DN11875_c0_g1_i1:113-520(+)
MAKSVGKSDPGEVKLGEIFADAKCLLNSEVGHMLAKRHDQFKRAFDDPLVKVSQMFEASLEYTKSFSDKQSEDDIKQVRNVLLGRGFSELEACMIGNLLPDSADEMKALVPSLKRFNDDSLEEMLNELPRCRAGM